MGLFIKKPFEALLAEANASGSKSLKRVLGPWSLVALGVGVIIGAGLFSITGTVAAGYTGPAITLSFAIAALGCCFAGLCYAEFASMIPVAGSAYTYSYATMGELIAWIIGWDLVLEYTVAATTVSISWSRYLVVFLEGLNIHLPQALTACPWDGGIVNIPAFLIVVLMSIFLIRGTEGSSIFNGIVVFLKVSVITIFVVLGWKYINADNYTPYIPANTGTLGEYGISGVLRGAAIVFFAFLGFDAAAKHCLSVIDQYSYNEEIPEWNDEGTRSPEEMVLITQSMKEVNQIMSTYVGIVRSDLRLKRAWDRLDILYEETESLFKRSVASKEICELRNMINVGYLIMRMAMERKESRGLHYTVDYPHAGK